MKFVFTLLAKHDSTKYADKIQIVLSKNPLQDKLKALRTFISLESYWNVNISTVPILTIPSANL